MLQIVFSNNTRNGSSYERLISLTEPGVLLKEVIRHIETDFSNDTVHVVAGTDLSENKVRIFIGLVDLC